MTGWTKAWIAWGSACVLSFLAIELRALQVPGATLSEHLRRIFGFDGVGPLQAPRRVIFYTLWGLFGLHIYKRTTGCDARPASDCDFPSFRPMPPA